MKFLVFLNVIFFFFYFLYAYYMGDREFYKYYNLIVVFVSLAILIFAKPLKVKFISCLTFVISSFYFIMKKLVLYSLTAYDSWALAVSIYSIFILLSSLLGFYLLLKASKYLTFTYERVYLLISSIVPVLTALFTFYALALYFNFDLDMVRASLHSSVNFIGLIYGVYISSFIGLALAEWSNDEVRYIVECK